MSREKNFVPAHCVRIRHTKSKGRTTPIAESQKRREVSPSRARANSAASNARLTKRNFPAVAKHRTSRTVRVLRAADATAYAQKHKNWPGKKLPASACDLAPPRSPHQVRFRDQRGEWYRGTPKETRGRFLVVERGFGHKRFDHRLARVIAVSKTSVIDPIPAYVPDVALNSRR